MEEKAYSAGMVKTPFWFLEFKKTISLLNSGMTLSQIKELNEKENIFSAETPARSAQTFSTVSTRAKALDPAFYSLFEESDIASQKVIALIAVMQSDVLFFEFMYEVYREKIIIGLDELSDSDFSIFFKNKQMQSERAAKWTDYTLKRLGSSYRNILMESGILERSTKDPKKITKAIIDQSLERTLKACKMEATLHALTGVR